MKKVLSTMLVLTMVLSIFTVTAFAAESDASIKFEEGDFVITDPDPDPTDPTLPPLPGPLQNLGVLKLDFGKLKITGIGFADRPTVDDEKLALIVTDQRGAGKTWKLEAEMDSFKSGGVDTLTGFSIDLKSPSAPIAGVASQMNPPSREDTFELNATNPKKTIMLSDVAGSQGQWGVTYVPTLNVAAGTESVGDHTADITWTLANSH